MKKIIITIVTLVLLITAAFWVKGYYNDRYVASEFYFTQIPLDEVNEESWLVDSDGIKQQKGKEYHFIGYDEQGKEREVFFTQVGDVENYYSPGTYIKVSMSKTITIGIEVVQEADVPQIAFNKTNGIVQGMGVIDNRDNTKKPDFMRVFEVTLNKLTKKRYLHRGSSLKLENGALFLLEVNLSLKYISRSI